MTLFTAAYCLSLGFVLGLSVMLKIARNAWLLSTNHRVTKLEAQIGKFQEESLYYMSQNVKMQAVVEAADEARRSIPGMLPKIEDALAALERG